MSVCTTCRSPKAPLQCQCCHEPLCKSCIQHLEEGTFSFLPKVPTELSHTQYCTVCYDQHIADALTEYNATLEKAKDVYIFYLGRKGNLPVFEQSKRKLSIAQCSDRDEILLRLAFQAAQLGFNAITQTDVIRTKVRDGAYQTMSWSVSGFPAKVDVTKIDRH